MSRATLVDAASRQDRALIEQEVLRASTATGDALSDTLPPMYLSLLTAGGDAEAEALLSRGLRLAKRSDLPPPFRFDKTNPAALEWARNRSGELIKEISDETRKSVREVLRQAFQDQGFPPRETARLLRGTIGLTSKQAAAVTSFRTRLIENPGKIVHAGSMFRVQVPKKGMPSDRLDRLVARYQERLERSRALTIARTETIASANVGQYQMWQQQIAAGNLNENPVRVWIASINACPICVALDGTEAALQENFAGGIQYPPAHPRCRCTTGLTGEHRLRRPAPEAPPLPPPAPPAPPPFVPTPVSVTPVPLPTPRIKTPKPPKHQVFKRKTLDYKTEEGKQLVKKTMKEAEAEIRKITEEFPGLRDAQLARMEVLDTASTSKYPQHKDALGLYWGSSDTISLPARISRFDSDLTFNRFKPSIFEKQWTVGENALMANLRHEFGHHVHMHHLAINRSAPNYYAYERLSGAQQEWRTLWNKYSAIPKDAANSIENAVSRYAATNERELFAESFSAYTHPQYGQSVSVKYGLREIVGEKRLPADIEAFMEKHIGKRVAKPAKVKRPRKAPTGATRVPVGASARISRLDIASMRERHAAGEKIYVLAREYRVRPEYVQSVVKRKIWRDVA